LLGGMNAASALNSPDWMNALKKAFAERALSAEMDCSHQVKAAAQL